MGAFLTIAGIHLLAVMSPGPDFALIMQKSLTRSRATAVWTSLGLACGVLVHVSYCLLGIGLIIAQSIVLFSIVKCVGALYLIYIGWHALRAKPVSADVDLQSRKTQSALSAVRDGFLCNVLNPKCTLFFLALFTQVISPSTPLIVQIGYGLFMAFQNFYWFAFLSWSLSTRTLRERIRSVQHHIEHVMGLALIALGLRLAVATRN